MLSPSEYIRIRERILSKFKQVYYAYPALDKFISMIVKDESNALSKLDEYIALCNDHPCADLSTLYLMCYNPLVISVRSKDRSCKIVLSRELGIWSVATNKWEVKKQYKLVEALLKKDKIDIRSRGYGDYSVEADYDNEED